MKNNEFNFYLSESYFKNGFIIIEDILNKDEILKLREDLYVYFSDKPDENSLYIDYFLESGLASLFFRKKLLKKLKLIFGNELVFINDFNLQYNAFDNSGPTEGLHVDCNSEFSPKSKYLFKKDYMFAKVGLYLQDNTDQNGGGIDVVVGSHKVWTRFPFSILNYIFSRFYLRLYKTNNKKRIKVPIKSGSAVVFDSRLLHSSSKPNNIEFNKIKPNPKFEDCKYTLYMDVCPAGNEKNFIDNSYKRALKEKKISTSKNKLFFAKYLSYEFPHDFPDYYNSLVKENKILVASIGNDKLRRLNEI
jgi:hypothetical protein